MNNRLIGLYSALQGGTRRKPKYLNVGALVSWVYPIKLKDTAGLQYSFDNIAVADTTFENAPVDTALFGYTLSSFFLSDSMVTPPAATDRAALVYSLDSFIITDVVKVVDGTEGMADTAGFNYTLNSVVFVDNVKVGGTLEDRAALSYQLNSFALEAP